MALDVTSEYGARAAAHSADYPLGSVIDDSTGSAGDGTPLGKNLMNDVLGFLQAMLSEAGIAASGAPDTAVNSQYLAAMKAIVSGLFEAQLSAGNGYLVTPTGVIIQWGVEPIASDVVGSRNAVFVFGKEFPAACFVVIPTIMGSVTNATITTSGYPTTTGVTLRLEETGGSVAQSLKAGYIAIGH